MQVGFFSFIYIACLFVLFLAVPGRFRSALLSLGSLGYIFCLSHTAAAVVLGVSALTYFSGIFLERSAMRGSGKLCTIFCIFFSLFCAAVLLIFKNFFPLLIPLGLSFYLFQAISYLVDIRRGTIRAQINIWHFLLYMCWCPKFLSGPIERAGDFIPQTSSFYHKKFPGPDPLIRALLYIGYGLFLKIGLANSLGRYVDFVFENYTACGNVWMAVSSLFYTMQIYTDFAGYSYIAVGISSLFGLNININFRNPYLAENISDFWRRWHISLSSFLRDYLYIPLGGNRKGTMRKCINISVVFIVCGLWHGGGMSFVIWGALHALYNIADIILRKKNINFIRSGHIGRILTFITVSFAWIFFRAPNTTIALDYIKNMATTVPVFSIFGMVLDSMGMSRTSFYVLLALLLVMAALDIVACRQNTHVPDMFLRMPFTLRCAAVYVMIMLTAIFGTYGPGIEANMIYMHF